jgi:hypothetical protein
MTICLRRLEFIPALGGAVAAWPLAARAQQGDRVRRIGVLLARDENDPVAKTYVPAFTEALAGLGWTDGRNVRMELRWYGDDANRSRALAQEFGVLRGTFTHEKLHTAIELEAIDISDERSDSHLSERVIVLPDPPVERHPDSSITWTHVLRTIHLQGIYLPVPVAARFRYPRFVGVASNGIVHCVVHESGREGVIWLDRAHNRFFGEVFRELLEWEEAGRKLHLHWRPEAIVIRRGEIDRDVHEEECRHLDPKALHELRLGKGESYRQALVSILRNSANGLDFRSLCAELAQRQEHRPSRATIRAVLYQSPGFVLKDGSWCWSDEPDSARVFRRRVILSAMTRDGERTSNLAEFARAVENAVKELSPSRLAIESRVHLD